MYRPTYCFHRRTGQGIQLQVQKKGFDEACSTLNPGFLNSLNYEFAFVGRIYFHVPARSEALHSSDVRR